MISKKYIKSYSLDEKELCNNIFKFSNIFNKEVESTIAPIYSCFVESDNVYLEQQFIEYPLSINKLNMKRVAALLARIHNSFRVRDIRESCFQEWDSRTMLRLLINNNKVQREERKVYQEIQLRIDEISFESKFCVIHGDFKIDNIRDNGKDCIAIDLDTMGKGESFIDVGRFIVDLIKNKKEDFILPFLNEYSNIMGNNKCYYNGAIELSLWVKFLWLKTKIVLCSMPWDERLFRTLSDLLRLTNDQQLKKLLLKLI